MKKTSSPVVIESILVIDFLVECERVDPAGLPPEDVDDAILRDVGRQHQTLVGAFHAVAEYAEEDW